MPTSLLVAGIVKSVLPTLGGFREHRNAGGHTAFILDAARRRDLRTVDIGMGHYFYRGDVLVGGTRQMLTSLVSSLAVSACNSKAVTKELFRASGVATPRSRTFEASALELGLEYVDSVAAPVVVKPSRGAGGQGVTCGVQTVEELRDAWARAAEHLPPSGSILVEEHVVGIDVRAYVVGGRVAAAATRLPAYVVGDGRRSIAELVEEKSALRARNAYLRRMDIVVDQARLRRLGMTMSSIPAADSVTVLNETANLHQGGENVDVTTILGEGLKDIAVRAAAAIPGLAVAGIDLLVHSLQSVEGAVVLEANTKANISVHHLPAHGQPIDVGAALVDEMIRTAPPASEDPTRPKPLG